MRIALDFDGTLADTSKLILDLMNWRLGTSYTPEDWTSWDFWRQMGPETEKAFWGIFDLMDNSYLRRALPPTDPFASAVVKWLLKRGHTVHLVTSNSEKGIPSFEGWLWAQGIEMPVITRGRGGTGARSKADMDYDLFIDDAPSLADEMKDHPSKILILYCRPLNASVEPTANVFPAHDWLEVKQLLEELGA